MASEERWIGSVNIYAKMGRNGLFSIVQNILTIFGIIYIRESIFWTVNFIKCEYRWSISYRTKCKIPTIFKDGMKILCEIFH